MKLLAHRGASADAPENTLAAFAEAMRQGADGVELDAMVCGSGEVVVCHDERLLRLAGLDWEVRRTSLHRLRQADIGTHLGFAPAGIPTLEEVLTLLPASATVNIELKCGTVEDDGLARKVVALVQARQMADRVLISSFNPLCLWRTAACDRSLRRGYLIEPERSFFFQSGVLAPLVASYSIHPSVEQCSRVRVQGWRARGWETSVWTVNDVESARRCRDWGVAFCITNRPGFLRAGL